MSSDFREVITHTSQEGGFTNRHGQSWYHRPWSGWEHDDSRPVYLKPGADWPMRRRRHWLATNPAWLRLLYALGSDRAIKAICYSDCGVMPWGTCHGHKRVEYRRAEG